MGLKWQEFERSRRTATLSDTKTARSVGPLFKAACDVLRTIRESDGKKADELVFRASRGDDCMSGFPRLFARITALGELPSDITPHVLRHSFASLPADLGYSEPTIPALVGHKG